MDECPNCHNWTMYYDSQWEEWQCFSCPYKITETRDSRDARLREENLKGRHSVDPPLIGMGNNPSYRKNLIKKIEE